ncbi:unnamed protein product [Vicia faba]|uniref:Uncharacterized protein n=1 Tax=Vicia faba TaxID=3906 RepID=A0AAV1B7D1_VICFA|nr:unnamed protein product [Vicia faba]
MNAAPTTVTYQRQSKQGNQGNNQRRENYDHIPMSHAELLPALIQKKLVQTRPPPAVPSPLPWYYTADQTCAFHQGAPGHSVENIYPLRTEVKRLVKSGILSFKDMRPNVKENPLPKHGGVNAVNMVAGCPGDFQIFDINLVRGDLVKKHADLCEFSYYTYDHTGCAICSTNIQGCEKIKADLQEMMDEGLIHIIRPRAEYEEEVNMVSECPGEFRIFEVEHLNEDLVQLHATFFRTAGQVEHQYGSCVVCCQDPRGCSIVIEGVQLLLDNGTMKVTGQRDDYHEIDMVEVCLMGEESEEEYASADEYFSSDVDLFTGYGLLRADCVEEGVNVIVRCFGAPAHLEVEYHSKPAVTPLVISLPGPVPYKSDKVVPYKCNATILEDGVEVPIQPMPDVGIIYDNSRVTHSGRVFAPVIRRDVVAGKKITENVEPKKDAGEASGATLENEVDDILKIIKMSD